MPSELEKARADVEKEEEKWRVLNLDPSGWTPVGGMLDIAMKLDVLTNLLLEKEIIDQEEADLALAKHQLQVMQSIRKELEPQIAAARLEAIKNGNLRRMH
jgi:hypothetical protein